MAGGPPCETAAVDGYPAALEALFDSTAGPGLASRIAADGEIAAVLASFQARVHTTYPSTSPALSFEVTLGQQMLASAHGGQVGPAGAQSYPSLLARQSHHSSQLASVAQAVAQTTRRSTRWDL